MKEIGVRDPNYSDAHATAFDSDGCATTAVPGADSKLIADFVDRVWQAFLAERDADRRSALLTLVGSTSTSDARVLRFLVEAFDGRFGDRVADSALHQAWGQCLRSPKHVGAAIQAMAGEAPKLAALVAMSRLMMYREHALKWLPSNIALEVTYGACARAAKCIAERSFHRVFRSAALCSAYVLRRRKYDVGFLAPGSSANSDVRQVYEAAAMAMERTPDRIMGGAVDIPGTVRRLLGYIDGRGSGTLVALAFED
jgi:hypothetical protein